MSQKTFKGLKKSGNHNLVHTGLAIMTKDSLGVPSPLVVGSTVRWLQIPANAAEVFIKGAVDVRISEESAMTGYVVIDKQQWHGFGVADMDRLYYTRDSISGNMDFYFVTA